MTSPPTATLPEAIEQAISDFGYASQALVQSSEQGNNEMRLLHDRYLNNLRATIAAALAEQWYDGWQQAILDHGHQDEAALRERAERLRREFIQRHAHDYRNPSTEELERFYGLQPGDLADDLVPKTT